MPQSARCKVCLEPLDADDRDVVPAVFAPKDVTGFRSHREVLRGRRTHYFHEACFPDTGRYARVR